MPTSQTGHIGLDTSAVSRAGTTPQVGAALDWAMGTGRQSVAYLTKRPVEARAKLSRGVCDEQLVTVPRTKPVIPVLNGVERPLWAYHRHDATTYPMPWSRRVDGLAAIRAMEH